jgi:hypothetical protein
MRNRAPPHSGDGQAPRAVELASAEGSYISDSPDNADAPDGAP